MAINPEKLGRELRTAGINICGCNEKGVVWGMDGKEIQDLKEVQAVIVVHTPEETPTKTIEEKLTELETKVTMLESKADQLEKI